MHDTSEPHCAHLCAYRVALNNPLFQVTVVQQPSVPMPSANKFLQEMEMGSNPATATTPVIIAQRELAAAAAAAANNPNSPYTQVSKM